MQVGDSFFVPRENGDRTKISRTLHSCAIRELGKGATTVRHVDGGVRAWRIK
jgi:hypothetical protein